MPSLAHSKLNIPQALGKLSMPGEPPHGPIINSRIFDHPVTSDNQQLWRKSASVRGVANSLDARFGDKLTRVARGFSLTTTAHANG